MDEPGTASGGSLFDYYLFIAQPVQVAHRFHHASGQIGYAKYRRSDILSNAKAGVSQEIVLFSYA